MLDLRLSTPFRDAAQWGVPCRQARDFQPEISRRSSRLAGGAPPAAEDDDAVYRRLAAQCPQPLVPFDAAHDGLRVRMTPPGCAPGRHRTWGRVVRTDAQADSRSAHDTPREEPCVEIRWCSPPRGVRATQRIPRSWWNGDGRPTAEVCSSERGLSDRHPDPGDEHLTFKPDIGASRRRLRARRRGVSCDGGATGGGAAAACLRLYDAAVYQRDKLSAQEKAAGQIELAQLEEERAAVARQLQRNSRAALRVLHADPGIPYHRSLTQIEHH